MSTIRLLFRKGVAKFAPGPTPAAKPFREVTLADSEKISPNFLLRRRVVFCIFLEGEGVIPFFFFSRGYCFSDVFEDLRYR